MFNYGAFFWNELMTDDVEAAKAFYAATLGWTFEGMSGGEAVAGTYWVAKAPGIAMPVAGIMSWPAGQPGGRDWFAYIAVKDLDDLIARTTAAGGELLRPPFEVPDVGRIAIVLDAAKSAIGFIQPQPM